MANNTVLFLVLCALAVLAAFALLFVIQEARKLTFVEWITVIGVAVILCALGGCNQVPLTPGQQEQARRERNANAVVYCETRGGDRRCKLVDRAEVERILRGW